MATTSFTVHQRTLSDEERNVVEHLLTTSISPDSSFNSVSTTDSDKEDIETVENALALPDYDDFDVAAIIHEEPDIDNLQIECHVFDPDTFPGPEPDATIVDESGRKILPFPLVTSKTDQTTQVVKSPQLYFQQIIAPYINNSSVIQLIADEPEDVSTPTKDTSTANGAPKAPNVTFIQVLNEECAEYIRLCGDNSKEAIKRNHRGPHWASVPGVDRQSKQAPFWTKFHLDHLAATLWLLGKDTATRHLIDFVASTFALRFPMLAARVRACERKLLALGCDPKIAKPLFGLWYNYCINGARPHASVEGVSCEPHTDAQNLAIMMCALFIYGDFDWEEKAWLVLWEAGVIIQLPIGVVFYYPSALFIHFNINIFDFHHYVFTTKTGEPPTAETSLPIHGVKGRGSIVFFNQASLFQYAELGSPVAEAAERGMPTAANNEPYMTTMPMFTKQ
ncbi:hypothetical protein LXA43DRAFT_1102131 [Ganoderma leucocontextum]|nr:hypothetical protein LXA43DRAFT_1102131 [Ganoderma leucocontextum]